MARSWGCASTSVSVVHLLGVALEWRLQRHGDGCHGGYSLHNVRALHKRSASDCTMLLHGIIHPADYKLTISLIAVLAH